MAMRSAVFAAAVLSVAATGGVTADAHACGFVDYRESRPVIRVPRPKPVPIVDRIAAADQRLDEEHPAEAAIQVVTAFPRIRSAQTSASPLETRALRILALAVARSDGRIAGVSGLSGATEAERGANLEWAVGTLRSINAARPDDPVAEADLGEALATRPKYEDESRAILGDLASRDLIGSAHAYAALARLHAGNAGAIRGALERCEAMTRSPTVVCRAPDARLALR
jgi:hypothetical protein